MLLCELYELKGRWWWNVRTKEQVYVGNKEHTDFARDNKEYFGVQRYRGEITPKWDAEFLHYVMLHGWVRCLPTNGGHGLMIHAANLEDAQACLRFYRRDFAEFTIDIGEDYHPLSRSLKPTDVRAYLALTE